jgi:hypothetical protein
VAPTLAALLVVPAPEAPEAPAALAAPATPAALDSGPAATAPTSRSLVDRTDDDAAR